MQAFTICAQRLANDPIDLSEGTALGLWCDVIMQWGLFSLRDWRLARGEQHCWTNLLCFNGSLFFLQTLGRAQLTDNQFQTNSIKKIHSHFNVYIIFLRIIRHCLQKGLRRVQQCFFSMHNRSYFQVVVCKSCTFDKALYKRHRNWHIRTPTNKHTRQFELEMH